MPGYKNYTIKKYEKGGLVETKESKNGKTVVVDEEKKRMEAMQNFLNEDTPYEEVMRMQKDLEKNPNKYTDIMGVPIKKANPK